MKILLSYSKEHFDPTKTESEHKYWASSASILARTLYNILNEKGELTYVDAWNYDSIKEQEYDLFVGIYANFEKIVKVAKIKKSVFFAVNMHPKERNIILKDFVSDNCLSFESISDWDLLSEKEYDLGLSVADYVLLVGNNETINSYLKNGVSINKIKSLNYGVENIVCSIERHNKIKKFLYLSSDIGLRKGFDIVYSCFMELENSNTDFELHVIGRAGNEMYKKKLEQLKRFCGAKVVDHGWIDSNSSAFLEFVDQCDYLIFPSLEEGQAGTVLDGISRGLVPIISRNSGFDFSPLNYLELSLNSNTNVEILKKAAALPDTDLKELSRKTIDYYIEFHKDFKKTFEDTIDNIISNELHPLVSIVMPIFNKEKSISSLLYFLDCACKRYGNVELIIIFDGCKDRTEEIVKRFYVRKNDYRVIFETTSNIFEVKSNNLGMKRSSGKYVVIIQDDNYIYDSNFIFEDIFFLENSNKAVILGNLAGVNYYPLGTKLDGKGQIAQNENEVYWRQDEKTDIRLNTRVFEVDACMRGPLVFKKDFLEKHGYLDEIYAPLYQDDMDICFRARQLGFKVYCMMLDVENKALTQAKYNKKKWIFFMAVIAKNTKIFYERWRMSSKKRDFWLHKSLIISPDNYIFEESTKAIKRTVLDLRDKSLKIKPFALNLAYKSYVKLKEHVINKTIK